jgi:uncharacterized protein (DUF488 family)
MLNRQRLILALLDCAGGPIQHTMLVKLVFLLRHETEVGQDRTFYEFVPYRHGPFSFGMYRELESLRRDGYVEQGERSFSLTPQTRRLSQEQIERLNSTQTDAVASVVSRYARRTRPWLLRDVYQRYPWYSIKSELKEFLSEDLPEPPLPEVAAYTIGYEGKSVDGFFNDLLAAGMTGVLDVRANPVSRKYGFAKRSMSRIASNLGLAYHHIPELGITGDHRAGLSGFESYQRLLDEYERTMLPERSIHVRQATSLLRSQPLALLCMEKDVRCCHRGRLADRIAEEAGMSVTHL